MPGSFLQIDPKDNVLAALRPLPAGEIIDWKGRLIIQENIPAKHKFAIKEIKKGHIIIMYGVVVGKAKKNN